MNAARWKEASFPPGALLRDLSPMIITSVTYRSRLCDHFFWYLVTCYSVLGWRILQHVITEQKSRNGDTLGPVELILWLDQGNQGDRREQDDQGEVSIIIFGMSKSTGFQKYSICWVFQALCLCLYRCLCHCLCLCICVRLWFLNSFHHKLSEYVWL